MYMSICMHLCVSVCVRACACMRVRVRACGGEVGNCDGGGVMVVGGDEEVLSGTVTTTWTFSSHYGVDADAVVLCERL